MTSFGDAYCTKLQGTSASEACEGNVPRLDILYEISGDALTKSGHDFSWTLRTTTTIKIFFGNFNTHAPSQDFKIEIVPHNMLNSLIIIS